MLRKEMDARDFPIGGVLWFICFMACSSDKIDPTTEIAEIETTAYSQPTEALSLHIENLQEKHLEIMLMAYKELEAYYGCLLYTSDAADD